MAMITFFTKFAELAVNETRTISVRGRDDLPDGEYGFIESYCDEASCDCRRVIISVLSATSGSKIWATINYGWENLEYYEQWLQTADDAWDCKGPSLDPLNPQTPYAGVLLGMFKYVLTDQAYVERLKRHYTMFKAAIQDEQKLKGQRKKRRKRKLRVVR